MMKYYSRNYLSHHGIKGMKWGIQNGPPYPLGNEQKNARERRFELTDKQKRYLKIAGAVVGTALLSYGAYKLYQSGALPTIATGKKIVGETTGITLQESEVFTRSETQNRIDPDGKLPIGGTAGDILKSMASVNDTNEIDHCQQNTVAACLNYLGFNVKIKPGHYAKEHGGIIEKCFHGDITQKLKEPNKVFSTADEAANWILNSRLKPKDGCCGTISCDLDVPNNADGHSAHAILWRMENGKILFSDPWAATSSGGHKVIEDASFYFNKQAGLFNGAHPRICMINNLEINYDEFFNYFEVGG